MAVYGFPPMENACCTALQADPRPISGCTISPREPVQSSLLTEEPALPSGLSTGATFSITLDQVRIGSARTGRRLPKYFPSGLVGSKPSPRTEKGPSASQLHPHRPTYWL